MFYSAVCVEKVSGEIGDHFAAPLHDHPRLLGHNRDRIGLQILFLRRSDKRLAVLWSNYDRHALLGFGDRKLGSVQTVILFAYSIQIDPQPVRQLADRDGDAAGTEVVAALDEFGHLTVTEQTLQLSLLRSIALLDLTGHRAQRFFIMALRGAGSAADTVTSGPTAKKDDNVPRGGAFAAYIFSGSGSDNRSAFQTLGHIALVVDFRHMPGSKTDLVAVRTIARSRRLRQLSLRQLSLQGFRKRFARISPAGYAHGLMDKRTAGERVPNAAANTGRRTAKRLDLRRMVMGLILEHQKPVLLFSVHDDRSVNGTGVDLFRLVKFREQPAFFQCLRTDGRQIHQGHRSGRRLFLAVHFNTRVKIALVCRFYALVFQIDLINMRREGRVSAVIGPIGVDHANLGQRRVALLFLSEIALEKSEIIQVHRKAEAIEQLFQFPTRHPAKAFYDLNISRCRVCDIQRLRFFQRSFSALNRVDDIGLDPADFRLRQCTVQQIDLGRTDRGAITGLQELDTLGRRVRALVELTRERLYRKDKVRAVELSFFRDQIQLRLGKNCPACTQEKLFTDVFHIIAIQNPDRFQIVDAEKLPAIGEQRSRFRGKARLFLDKNSINHVKPPQHARHAAQYHGGTSFSQSGFAPLRCMPPQAPRAGFRPAPLHPARARRK